jgi:hypothetical protein
MKTHHLKKKCWLVVAMIIYLVSDYNLSAQQTVDNQKKIIFERVTEFLGKYQLYGQLSKDGVTLDEEYIKEFHLLFDKDKFREIFSDLSKDGKTIFFHLEDYIAFVRAFYPQGLDQSLDLDSLSFIESPNRNGIFRIIVKARKHLTGLYGGYEIHSYDGDQYFFITVPESELANISGYKIVRVLSQEKYLKYLASRKSKGIYIGFSGGYDITRIFSSPIYSSKIWTPKMVNSINPGVDLTFMVTNKLGLETGFRKFEYGSLFTIKDYNQISEVQLTDIDGDTYNPVLNIPKLTENNTIKCYEIPILIKTRSGNGITKFFFDFGVVYSVVKESYFTLNGKSTVEGYYPLYSVTLKNLPEYGFGDFIYTPSKHTQMTLKKQLISANVALGVSFNLGSSFLLKIGTRINYGLTDIGFNTIRHPSDFKSTLTKPITPTILQSAGVEIGLSYKIL